ncbi:MAG: phage holin family protein [Chloroflexota bacterium]|nr:phage holin family protein [Chloroflexota bacterium]MDE3193517.1 phage holin family protein [Chloroflexota bacterium]
MPLVGFLVRTLVTAASLWIATQLVPGLAFRPPAWTADAQTNYLIALVVSAVALGILNAFVRPVLFVLSLPVTCMTLGVFILVLNGIMLLLLSWLPLGFHVDGIVSAVVGGLIVSVVSFLLNHFVPH